MHRRRVVVSNHRKNLRRFSQAIEPLEMRRLFANVLGIDISSAVSNWSTLKNSDNEQFAYVQSSFGAGSDANPQTNNYWKNDVSGAKAANVPIGVYHFAYPDSSGAVAEADYFYTIASSAMKPGNLPPMLDIEEGSDLSTTALSNWVNAFCNELKSKSGVTPVVYTYTDFAVNNLGSSVTQWPLWIANYDGDTSSEAVTSGPWSSTAWIMHQYAGTTGLSGDSVDLNVFKGTLAQLQAFEIQPTTPEISVAKGTTDLTDGTSTVNFGTVNVNATDTISFTVTNSGGGTLTLGTVTTTGSFTVFAPPGSTSLAAGASTTFTLKMTTTSAGLKTGTVSFATNDSNENPFNFSLSGVVNDPTPTAPTNLHFTTYASNSVTMAWTDNSINETAFLIERKTGSGGTYSQIASLAGQTTSWTDSAATDSAAVPVPGTTYFYRVRAVNGSFFSGYAAEQSIMTLAATPTNVVASDGAFTDHVVVTWNASQGAASYQVYRASTATGTPTAIGSPVTTTAFNDALATPGTTFYYWVASLNSASGAGAPAGPDSGYATGDITPPTLASASFSDDQSPLTLSFQFSEPMRSMSTGNLVISNLDGGVAPGATSYAYANNVASFTIASNGLLDAHYRATISGAMDLAGNPLSGTNSFDFNFLDADANGDGTIDSTDFGALAAHFGMTGAMKFSQGDFNYDGIVNALDFNALASGYGDKMSPAGSSPADAVAPAALPGAAKPAASLFSNQPISPMVIDLTDNSDNSVLT